LIETWLGIAGKDGIPSGPGEIIKRWEGGKLEMMVCEEKRLPIRKSLGCHALVELPAENLEGDAGQIVDPLPLERGASTYHGTLIPPFFAGSDSRCAATKW
jgi:hypothetical protein